MRSQMRRPGVTAALLLVSLLLIVTSPPTAAQTTQATKRANNGNTCEFGEDESAAVCQNTYGHWGALGVGDEGVRGQHNNGNYGWLGGRFVAVRGHHHSGNYGYLGSSIYGAYGEHTNGPRGSLGSSIYGARGQHTNGNAGILGGSQYGVYGVYDVNHSFGYLGSDEFGAYGENDNGHWGSLGGANTGAYGQNTNGNFGILGSNNYAVRGFAANGWAGYFQGDVQIIGTLSKSGGSFKIDHPLDHENRYLAHSLVESPDMMNVYNGNVTTDAAGEVVVELPSYFEALNRDFRYQLTVIGTFAQAIVARKIQDNRFVIRTDRPNVEVSWQVTGIRQDRWANEHRVVVEEDKPAEERGFYLYPKLYGQPEERSVEWARDAEGMRALQEIPARMEAERQQMEEERRRMQAEREHMKTEQEQRPPRPRPDSDGR